MDHPHLHIACELWAAIAAADVSALRRLLSPKTRWRMRGNNPLAGCHEGLEGVLAFLARVGELTDELSAELLEVFVAEGGAVLRYAIHARRGHQTLDTEHLFWITIRDGRITDAVFAPLDPPRYDAFWRTQ